MTHETARQRAARQKRDPLRKAQIAPRVIAPTRCECGHSRIMHDPIAVDLPDGAVELDVSPACGSYGCDCTSYREA